MVIVVSYNTHKILLVIRVINKNISIFKLIIKKMELRMVWYKDGFRNFYNRLIYLPIHPVQKLFWNYVR